MVAGPDYVTMNKSDVYVRMYSIIKEMKAGFTHWIGIKGYKILKLVRSIITVLFLKCNFTRYGFTLTLIFQINC